VTRCRGQASVEYLVASVIVLCLVALPVRNGQSAVGLLLSAMAAAFGRLSAFLSLPGG
jgi:hypothetical protein